jgi:hypothetical protein
MNKMHVIAKIAAGILGIYLLLISVMALFGAMAMTIGSWSKMNMSSLAIVVIALIITFCFACMVFYFLIYRSDLFARKIVGREEEFPEPLNSSAWYPFALRLAVIAAGLLFLQKSIMELSTLSQMARYAFQSNTSSGINQVYEYGISFLIYLAISIYLLCGAPQFVQWQIKKTKQLYGSV